MSKKSVLAWIITACVILLAIFLIYESYKDYADNPWTRDGQITASLVPIAVPSGGIVQEILIKENSRVKKGEILFKLDTSALELEKEALAASLALASIPPDSALSGNISDNVSGSMFSGNALPVNPSDNVLGSTLSDKMSFSETLPSMSPGALPNMSTKASSNASPNALPDMPNVPVLLSEDSSTTLSSGEIFLPAVNRAANTAVQARIKILDKKIADSTIQAPVSGYITGFSLKPGSYAAAETPLFAIIDEDSFRVTAFFRETFLSSIHPGDSARLYLMAYPDSHLRGTIESIDYGIARANGSFEQFLPEVSPSFDWVRLAQRVPVRIKINHTPPNVILRVGLSVSVQIHGDQYSPSLWMKIRNYF